MDSKSMKSGEEPKLTQAINNIEGLVPGLRSVADRLEQKVDRLGGSTLLSSELKKEESKKAGGELARLNYARQDIETEGRRIETALKALEDLV